MRFLKTFVTRLNAEIVKADLPRPARSRERAGPADEISVASWVRWRRSEGASAEIPMLGGARLQLTKLGEETYLELELSVHAPQARVDELAKLPDLASAALETVSEALPGGLRSPSYHVGLGGSVRAPWWRITVLERLSIGERGPPASDAAGLVQDCIDGLAALEAWARETFHVVDGRKDASTVEDHVTTNS